MSELAADLYRRRDSGVHVPYVSALEDGQSLPENNCHQNVAFIVKKYPRAQRVRGFLYNDSLLPLVTFHAHSVVRSEDGNLIDVTPNRASRPYPFIEHSGAVELFEQVETKVTLHHYAA